MNIFLIVYLFGCIASVLMAVCTLRDRDGNIEWIEFGIIIILSLCSWSAFLGFLLGYLLIRRSDNQ